MTKRDWRYARELREKQIYDQSKRDQSQFGGHVGKSDDKLRKEARQRAENETRIGSNETKD